MPYLKPFFPYYGSKYQISPKYPVPKYDKLVEPFAGSASYSLSYPDCEVVLSDVNPVICELWKYLTTTTEERILSLPSKVESRVSDLPITSAEKILIGFWINRGSAAPRDVCSTWEKTNVNKGQWGDRAKDRIAAQLRYIRHWRIECRSFDVAEEGLATYFVDPPYSGIAGKHYPYRFSDYARLSDWCKSRNGQVIVCEKEGADWLPFSPLADILVSRGTKSQNRVMEVFWTNEG